MKKALTSHAKRQIRDLQSSIESARMQLEIIEREIEKWPNSDCSGLYAKYNETAGTIESMENRIRRLEQSGGEIFRRR